MQSVTPDGWTTVGPDGLSLKSGDGKVNLLVMTAPPMTAYGFKSTDDVTVILDNEASSAGGC